MKKKLFPVLALLVALSVSGCAGIKNSMRISEKNSAWNPVARLSKDRKGKQADDAKPMTMAVIWSDAVMENAAGKSEKGFGGRFYFYDADNTAIQAAGELIVYGFDDSIKDKTKDKPDVKAVFKESEFQSHFSESGLGASYSVWLPWEPVGGYRKSITLIPIFKTEDGRILKSGQSINILPGKVPAITAVIEQENHRSYEVLGHSNAMIQQASYQPGMALPARASQADLIGTQAEDSPNKRTTDIRMTPSMGHRIAIARNTVRQKQLKDAVENTKINPRRLNRVLERTSENPASEKATDERARAALSEKMAKPRGTFGVPGQF